MSDDAIRIEGLKELNRSLRSMDRNLPKALRLAGNEAAQVVVNEARARVPRKSGRAARSIKVSSTRTLVRVSEGGNGAVYMPFLDFGGAVGRRRSVRRPFIKKGRYLWKSFADHRAQVEETYRDELAKVARDSGIEMS